MIRHELAYTFMHIINIRCLKKDEHIYLLLKDRVFTNILFFLGRVENAHDYSELNWF